MSPSRHERAALLSLCGGYFAAYVVTGVLVKYFQGDASDGLPGMSGPEYLVYNTLGGSALCLGVVLGAGWLRRDRALPEPPAAARARWTAALASGACTAVIIPATTLMYLLPVSVMVAMVIMRGSIIVISRVVDAVLAAQGISRRAVAWEENAAVGFALLAVGANLRLTEPGGFTFLTSVPAMAILGSYVAAYALRIYLMNWFKAVLPAHGAADNRWWFGAEQVVASSLFLLGTAGLYVLLPPENAVAAGLHAAVARGNSYWPWAVASGLAFGAAAFFSVFLFMFQGRNATFNGLVNRLTSLVAGTLATLVAAAWLGTAWPSANEWVALGLILAAVGLLARAESRR